MTDDWAATFKMPTTSTPRRQQGRLLPLLLPKNNHKIEQVQAEMHATQSKMKALQKVNNELCAKADEAKKVAHGTRPLIARLMRTARALQGTLMKLVTAIVNYQLTHEEQVHLHLLPKDNDVLTCGLAPVVLRSGSQIPITDHLSNS